MSPATDRLPPETEIAPAETTSPCTSRMPLPETEIATPGWPPHPPWFRAATAGAYSRLFTPPDATADSRGVVPLVRMRANWRASDLDPVMVNRLPAGPSPL